ncbi:TM0106 family RecB-like putative nuclease [Quadrisphaera setariae]|uniref:TM0106 family RecB-like putative nuclease n=1 Tax=Quadrisphaera setariae TaxID=2593304 RepID=A0A5C8ZE27_9ACTN|nr:TM0106 family RecB-like putative nuclease [Quadrisphaera setariae]TXR55453.1 TM0106 family RecB-like putative nuclease [Quadrisphaera setariae]
MRRTAGGWWHSPRDLMAALECDHRLRLEHAAHSGLLQRPPVPLDGSLELVAQHGLEHERDALAALKALVAPRGGRVVEITAPQDDETGPSDPVASTAAAMTRAALDAQVDVVHQAALVVPARAGDPLGGGFLGFADFLVSVDLVTGEPVLDEATGRRRYEPVDAKLARTARPTALLQTAAYADALVALGHPVPQKVHLWLGGAPGGRVASERAADLLPLVAEYRERVLAQLATSGPVTPGPSGDVPSGADPSVLPEPLWADARPACGTCPWAPVCETGREDARDLSLVAGIRRDQVHRLRERGATTVEALAVAGDDQRPPSMSRPTFERLRAQAALQARGDAQPPGSPPLHVVHDDAPLRLLPEPDAGDLYYDIEGDPFADGGEGLEYLHGLTGADGSFTAHWAHDRAQERVAFEAVVDTMTAAAAAHPGMHVYHYAAYERTALLALAVRHQTREAEVDQLLREGRLVDLYAVVRSSVRVSAPSYSIKKLEPLYMGSDLRSSDVKTAGDSIVQYEHYAALTARGFHDDAAVVLEAIRDYNAYDCESTRRLHDWLLALVGRTTAAAAEAAAAAARAAAEQAVQDSADPLALAAAVGVDDVAGSADGSAVDGPDAVVRDLVGRLLAGVPAHAGERTDLQHAQALLAASLGYYPREHKPFWWEHFDRLRTPLDELAHDDGVVVLDRVDVSDWEKPPRARTLKRTVTATTSSGAGDVARLGRSPHAVYEAPAPEGMQLSADSARGTHARCGSPEWDDGVVTFVESTAQGGVDGWPEVPVALFPSAPPATKGKEAVVLDLARAALAELDAGREPDEAWWRLLLRRAPGLHHAPADDGADGDGADTVAAVTSALLGAGRDVVAVQGPPGTGKTYVGSRVIAALAQRGWRIGVVAQSHQVVENLLERVVAVRDAGEAKDAGAAQPAARFTVAKPKQDGDERDATAWERPPRVDAWLAAQEGGCVLGGTSWTFAQEKVRSQHLDLLVVDEAGQFALVDALVAGSAAERVLLLGDPQQLPQVCQGTHPEPVDVSALRHLLGDASLVPPEAGYLLDTTWRMHSRVCEPVSQLQYEGVLAAHPRTADRHLEGVEPGVHLHTVDHRDRTTSSPEEAARVVELVGGVLGRTWTDEDGAARPVGQEDVLVVAPFNRQVSLLRAALAEAGHEGVQVGTVDKFQGREAPVVVVSMATSSGDDLPRGVEFLLSRNRLNVALSRAMWAAHLVHSPALRSITPTTAEGLVALGAFVGVLRRGAGGRGVREVRERPDG